MITTHRLIGTDIPVQLIPHQPQNLPAGMVSINILHGDGGSIRAATYRSNLTPALPEEPPRWGLVQVVTEHEEIMVFQRVTTADGAADGYVQPGDTTVVTWADVCALAASGKPTRLIPNPAADETIQMPFFGTGLDDERIQIDVERAPNGGTYTRLAIEVELGNEERADDHHVRVWTYVDADILGRALLVADAQVQAATPQ